MNSSTRFSSIRPASLVMAAVFACTAALAGGADGSKSSSRAEGEKYRQECMAGKTHQDRATCLKEANNYLADLRKNPGKFESSANVAANAKARCEPLSGSERTACVARISGQGKIVGSVEGGGIYRELVTLESPAPIIQGADTPPPVAADAPATQ